MQVSLKKAAELSRAAIAAADKLPVVNTVALSIYSKTPVETAIETARATAEKAVAEINALLTVGHNLRRDIARVNAKVGISDLLTDRAGIEALEKRIERVIDNLDGYGCVRGDDIEVVKAQLAAMHTRVMAATSRIVEESLTVAAISSEQIEAMKKSLAALRRRKAEIKDDLARLNLSSTITVSDADLAVLQRHDLV